ncbi:MAG TPA: HDOD domain-containing protein [Bryobacteraceae bacterium]|nr:HDOD domain-containing protein [Bryobacteraceae bacterium]
MKPPSREERIANCVSSLTAKPDFPAFSQHVQKILAAVEDNDSTVGELTALIMRDYSLSLKLLRTANIYNLSGRQILSVSHAVIMIGTEGVRNLASSLLIFEHFFKKPAGLRELMTLSMLSANHVREIAARVPVLRLRPEEAFLCGMVRNLGEILVGYYLPGPYTRILKRMAERKQSAPDAAMEVLQFTFEDIGEAVIRYWRMPEVVAACQQAQSPPGALRDSPESLMYAAVNFGHHLTNAVYRMDPKEGAEHLKACLREHSAWLPMERKDVEQILKSGLADTQESFSAMGVQLDELRLMSQSRAAVAALSETKTGEPVVQVPATRDSDLLERLAKEVSAAVDGSSEIELNAVIAKLLDAFHRGAGFDRVIFAFLSEDGTAMEGRLGVGTDVDALISKFKFRMSLSGGPVPVALLSRRNVAADAGEGEAGQIGKLFGGSYLCLYPLVVARQVIGCIYGDCPSPKTDLSSRELSTLEELRDSLATAMARMKRRSSTASGESGAWS